MLKSFNNNLIKRNVNKRKKQREKGKKQKKTDIAIKLDKRTFFQYYFSLVKKNNIYFYA